MDDVLTDLSFHPGHPILILFGLIAALAYTALGAVVFWKAPRVLRIVWSLGMVLLLGEAVITGWVWTNLDWNPRVSPTEAVGNWRGDGLSLDLFENHTFRAGSRVGEWELQGHGLGLRPEPDGFSEPGFMRIGTRLRLRPVRGDPDDWAGELGLRKAEGP